MLGTRRLFEPGVYLNLGVILEIYGICLTGNQSTLTIERLVLSTITFHINAAFFLCRGAGKYL